MKLKYYLRGLGIGIILTTIILTISYSGRKTELTDEEIIKRAEVLGMVMKEDILVFPAQKQTDTKTEAERETEKNMEIETDKEDERNSENESQTSYDKNTEQANVF